MNYDLSFWISMIAFVLGVTSLVMAIRGIRKEKANQARIRRARRESMDSPATYKHRWDNETSRASLQKWAESVAKEAERLRDGKTKSTYIITHPPADANPATHTYDELGNCDACTQAPGWFPGKYADVTMVERNRKALEMEEEWLKSRGLQRNSKSS